MSAGRYEMESSLRASFFGDILLCRDRITLERVVVKSADLYLALHQTSRSQELVQENVQLEVEVLNHVRALGGHPNVINMHSYFVVNGVLHVVLDYCEGGDLLDAYVQPPSTADKSGNSNCNHDNNNQKEDTAVARGAQVIHAQSPEDENKEDRNGLFLNGADGFNRLHESVAHKYLVDVLSGLRFLHSYGIAHRDVSLENILMRNGCAVITDFGLCVQDASLSLSSSDSSTASEFRCEEMVGKNYYMAPEIVAHERYDPRRADIWSTGIAFFILLTSSPPFERADPSDPGFRYVAKCGIKAVFTAWGLDQEVSEEMQDLLGRMLCVDPEERITMDETWQHPVLQRTIKTESHIDRIAIAKYHQRQSIGHSLLQFAIATLRVNSCWAAVLGLEMDKANVRDVAV
ncbi:unnamed protein product [Peronospora farinosa]|uniref:Protein kinase domain-containing protein n=1 Tax=Peronospora farinosa TaxID=134698 RepID=A0AAV0TG40_9STRA|nr:unnamed protein product [Peronospora farinosa]